jgi:hypothetical protein
MKAKLLNWSFITPMTKSNNSIHSWIETNSDHLYILSSSKVWLIWLGFFQGRYEFSRVNHEIDAPFQWNSPVRDLSLEKAITQLSKAALGVPWFSWDLFQSTTAKDHSGFKLFRSKIYKVCLVQSPSIWLNWIPCHPTSICIFDWIQIMMWI